MNLVALLLAASEPVPLSEVIGRVAGFDDEGLAFNTLEKRFDRDRKDLRAIGLDVEYLGRADGMGGYRIDRSKSMQKPLNLLPSEAALLAIAGRIGAAATGGGALHEALKSALRKLAVDIPTDDPTPATLPLLVARRRRNEVGTHSRVELLARAVSESLVVRFSYLGGRDTEPNARTVTPFGLGLALGAWYLVGACHDRNAVRVFRLSRMAGSVSIDHLAAPRRKDADFDLRSHLPVQPFDVGKGEKTRIVLRLRGARRAQVFDPALSPRVVTQDRDGLVVELKARHPEGFVHWILTAGGDIEALEPSSLRQRVHAAALNAITGGDDGDDP